MVAHEDVVAVVAEETLEAAADEEARPLVEGTLFKMEMQPHTQVYRQTQLLPMAMELFGLPELLC